MPKIRVAIYGAAGRMGRRLVALGSEDQTLDVVAGVAVWMLIAAMIVAVILRLMFFYVDMINNAASGKF
jgi:dihydrodipicolinate reductase